MPTALAKTPSRTLSVDSIVERIQNQRCEEHGLLAKTFRTATVPLFNVLPERIVRKLLGLSPDGAMIMNHCGSTLALEVMYAWHEKDPFASGVLGGLASVLWNHLISQPKAMRNRLRIVQKILRERIAGRLCTSRAGEVSILSLGGGSSRALIQAISDLEPLAARHSVRVVNLDRDEKAAVLGRQLAERYGVSGAFRWVEGNAKDLHAVAKDGSVDIVEMVGLFDYFPERIGELMLRRIHRKLKPGGTLVLANVHPHDEMSFVSKIGWPKMTYRKPENLRDGLAAAGFEKPPEIIFEPMGVHMIVTITK
jgi:SAM-dependent methyltransferase